MTGSAVKQSVERPAGAALLMATLLVAMWLLEGIDQLSGNALDAYGIRAQELDGLPFIFTAPFLHFGFDHLIGNSIPFFVLGFVVLLGGLIRWLWSSLISILSSGLTAWAFTPDNTIVLGASGLIFGWLAYLLARGIFSRDGRQILIAVGVLFVYGGMILSVLPGEAGISWQGHLGGAAGGVLAAWLLYRRRSRRRLRYQQNYPARGAYGPGRQSDHY